MGDTAQRQTPGWRDRPARDNPTNHTERGSIFIHPGVVFPEGFVREFLSETSTGSRELQRDATTSWQQDEMVCGAPEIY